MIGIPVHAHRPSCVYLARASEGLHKTGRNPGIPTKVWEPDWERKGRERGGMCSFAALLSCVGICSSCADNSTCIAMETRLVGTN